MSVRVLLTALFSATLWGCASPTIQGGKTDPGAGQPGFATACLATDGEALQSGGEQIGFLFNAAVVDDGPAPNLGWGVECYGTPSRAIEMLADDGTTWWFGYGIQDGQGEDRTPEIPVSPGHEVVALFRSVQSFGVANGFVLTDAIGLLAAVESGTWGGALQDGDVHGLSVYDGSPSARESTDCGTVEHEEIRFNETSLQPFSRETIDIGGVDIDLWAVSNWEWVGQASCTDVSDERTWAAVRTGT